MKASSYSSLILKITVTVIRAFQGASSRLWVPMKSVKPASAARHPDTCSEHVQGAGHRQLITVLHEEAAKTHGRQGPTS